MGNQLVEEYTNQGLNRLAKEKLVTIISNLQNMQTAVAMKLSENVPAFLTTCDDALSRTDKIYAEAMAENTRYTQIILDNLDRDRKFYEQRLTNAESDEEREKLRKEINDIDEKVSSTKAQALKDRNDLIKDRAKFYLMVLSLMGASVGVAIKVGKRFK